MRLYAGKKIGQSEYELVLSVFFSFFLHAALIVLALVLYTAVPPKAFLPPFYEVKLVGQPAEIAPAPASSSTPPLPKTEPAPVGKKPQPKVKIAPPKPLRKALNKSAMPELVPEKPKPAKNEEAVPQAKPAPLETASVPGVSPVMPAKQGGETAVGEVKATSQNPKLDVYARRMREIIGNNWNPPPGAKGIKATVLFKVLHSGKIVEVTIEKSSANDIFDLAARRAILELRAFPAMPDDVYKDSEHFSIDLMPQE
jgi:TonB family protein